MSTGTTEGLAVHGFATATADVLAVWKPKPQSGDSDSFVRLRHVSGDHGCCGRLFFSDRCRCRLLARRAPSGGWALLPLADVEDNLAFGHDRVFLRLRSARALFPIGARANAGTGRLGEEGSDEICTCEGAGRTTLTALYPGRIMFRVLESFVRHRGGRGRGRGRGRACCLLLLLLAANVPRLFWCCHVQHRHVPHHVPHRSFACRALVAAVAAVAVAFACGHLLLAFLRFVAVVRVPVCGAVHGTCFLFYRAPEQAAEPRRAV